MAGSSSSCLQRETRCMPSVSPALNSGPSYPRLSILRTVNIVFPSAFHLLTYTLSASHFINGVQLLSRKASLFLRRRKVVLARYWRSALYSSPLPPGLYTVSYTHLRAHETDSYLVCRLLLEKKTSQANRIS